MIVIRLGLYLSLMLLVGIAAFPLYALRKAERANATVFAIRRMLAFWCAVSILLSILGFLVLIANMAETPISDPDWQTGSSILFETPIGSAWLVRMAALLIALAAAHFSRSDEQRLIAAVLAGSIALSTLVWTGHAGATEGTLGLVHKISDILHMLAAAIWLGGIAAFLLLLTAPSDQLWGDRLVVGHRALEEFSLVGTICVSVIVATGLVNGQILVGIENTPNLFNSAYGQLLLVKLLLVGAMMLLAAKNRWRLTPDLGRALSEGSAIAAVAALRKSLLREAAGGVAILGLVAWLGTIEPTASMAMS